MNGEHFEGIIVATEGSEQSGFNDRNLNTEALQIKAKIERKRINFIRKFYTN